MLQPYSPYYLEIKRFKQYLSALPSFFQDIGSEKRQGT